MTVAERTVQSPLPFLCAGSKSQARSVLRGGVDARVWLTGVPFGCIPTELEAGWDGVLWLPGSCWTRWPLRLLIYSEEGREAFFQPFQNILSPLQAGPAPGSCLLTNTRIIHLLLFHPTCVWVLLGILRFPVKWSGHLLLQCRPANIYCCGLWKVSLRFRWGSYLGPEGCSGGHGVIAHKVIV